MSDGVSSGPFGKKWPQDQVSFLMKRRAVPGGERDEGFLGAGTGEAFDLKAAWGQSLANCGRCRYAS